MQFEVHEVHNFGGFFAGETVEISGAALEAPRETRTLTIDQAALANIPDRYAMAPGMVLELRFAGERVEAAQLLAASSHAQLRAALGPVALSGPLAGPVVLAQRCPACNRWFAGAGSCPVCAPARQP